MFKIVVILAAGVLCVPIVAAETQEMRLLNPDGTPAADAKVIVVPKDRVAVVNRHLEKWRPEIKPDFLEPENKNRTISFDVTAKAVIAQNENGFVFVPAEVFAASAQLRPWAFVKLDTQTFPDEYRRNLKIDLLWTNSFSTSAFGDFSSQAGNVDWRFSLITAIHTVVEAKDATIRVPPGETAIEIIPSPEHSDQEDDPEKIQSLRLRIGPWVVPSGVETEIAFPEFGSVEGTFAVSNDGLPNWSEPIKPERSAHIRPHFDSLPNEARTIGRNNPGLENAEARDRLARFTASKEGRAHRRTQSNGKTAAIDGKGKFRIEMVPVGEYKLFQMVQDPNWPPLDESGKRPANHSTISVSFPAFALGQRPDAPLVFRVVAGQTTDVGQVDVAVLESSFVSNARGDKNSFEPRKTPKPSNEADPFRPSQNAQPNVNGMNSPVRHSQYNRSPFASPQTDATTTLIQQWLKVHGTDSNEQLLVALREHLEREFTANQKSREAEMERLQQLIKKSKEWLDQRNKNRDKIINKRVEELLPKAK
jgi:hypothetical protein